jgi:hypothetical protein
MMPTRHLTNLNEQSNTTFHLLARLLTPPFFIDLKSLYLISRHYSDTISIFYSNDYQTLSSLRAGLEPAGQKLPSLYVPTCLVC